MEFLIGTTEYSGGTSEFMSAGCCLSRSLKDQLQPELNHPRPSFAQARVARRYVRRFADRAEGRAVEVHVRQTQVGVIEQVEELRAELQRRALMKLRRFAHGKVHDMQGWPNDCIARGGAERAFDRAREGRFVEPPGGVA